MTHPRKLDNSPISVFATFGGKVYVDTVPFRDNLGYCRSGPDHPPHSHRFEDYGLADGLQRCRKCGLVEEK